MYAIDERDQVKELTDLPQSSVGAPLPLIFASEHELVVAYFVEVADPDCPVVFVEHEDGSRKMLFSSTARMFGCYIELKLGGVDKFLAHDPEGADGVRECWLRRLRR